MGCSSCSSNGSCTPAGCKSNGSCMTDGGCGKLDVYDWLADISPLVEQSVKPFSVVEVRFKGARKEFYKNTNNIHLELGDLVAVEGSQNGFDVGHVSLSGELVRLQMKRKNVNQDESLRTILRKASATDIERWTQAKQLEEETMHQARTMALSEGLKMKISDVDFQGDRTKATFYYTAEERVDFRELIRKMADTFRVRIEMRQIGMRQEASRLGGIGSCGRELCCSTWLTDFKTVSTAAARYQNLSLNILKLAGQCGKLKCCLNYEMDTYLDALKDIPDNISSLQTERGTARLVKTDIFKRIMWFNYPESNDWIPLSVDKVREINKMNLNNIKVEDLKAVEHKGQSVQAPSASFDYENVVGQDSLTRLDDRNRGRNRRNNKRRNAPTENGSASNSSGVSNKTLADRATGVPKGNTPVVEPIKPAGVSKMRENRPNFRQTSSENRPANATQRGQQTRPSERPKPSASSQPRNDAAQGFKKQNQKNNNPPKNKQQ